MGKGISTIIASILMLVIAISLVGSAWVFISGVYTRTVSTTFSIIDINYGNVTIRNEGTVPISSMSATVDGQTVNVLFPDGPIQPGSTGTVTLQGLPATKGGHTLRLATSSMVNRWWWEYPIIAVYDADGENFYLASWGRFSSNQIYDWLTSAGFAVAKISSDLMANGNISNYDIFILSTGEGYPARGKSFGTNGGNIWENIKDHLRNGGKLLYIGAYPFYYPGRWDGSTWVDDCSLVPAGECRDGAGRALELHFWDVDGNSIIKTSDGEKYFPNSADSASGRDYRPMKGWPGEFNPENELIRLWNTDTGNYGISMVRYKDGIYNGVILKVSGGGPDHVTALGGKTFIVEAVLTLLNS